MARGGFFDRVATILITATITSAAWILFGSHYLTGASWGGSGQEDETPAMESSEQAAPAPRGTSGEAAEDALASSPARAETSQLAIPVLEVTAAQLTDTYTDQRAGGERLHEAIDIMAPAGTSVIAAAPGRIERLFVSEAGGNTIYVRSPDGKTIYYYAHLEDYAAGLKEGQTVRRGQRLGTVGSSGNADPAAPHLHFAIMRTTPEAEWWEPAIALNPYPLLTAQR